jgi:lipopolysaccharide export system permease protein
MSWWELRAKSDDPEVLRSRGEAYVRSLEVEKQKRLALPMACFVLGFFALPMGWMFEGVKRHFGALAVLGMFFVYYGVFTLGLSLGETGALSPAMGVWLPNAAFLGLAAAALRIAVRERGLWFLRVSRKKKSAATHNPA